MPSPVPIVPIAPNRATVNGNVCTRNPRTGLCCIARYVRFLRSVTSKLVAKGYQPYLETLLNLMDFNEYYMNADQTADAGDPT